MKYVVDTSLINKLVDGTVGADELPSDGTFVASHIQVGELKRTRDPKRRAKLLDKFTQAVDEVLPTESFVLGVPRLDEGKVENGRSYNAIKANLDSLNKGNASNREDALIAESAIKNGYVLVTADFHLYQVADVYGIGVIYWTTN